MKTAANDWEHGAAFLESAAALAMDAGAIASHNEEVAHGVDSHRRP